MSSRPQFDLYCFFTSTHSCVSRTSRPDFAAPTTSFSRTLIPQQKTSKGTKLLRQPEAVASEVSSITPAEKNTHGEFTQRSLKKEIDFAKAAERCAQQRNRLSELLRRPRMPRMGVAMGRSSRTRVLGIV